MSYRGVSGGIGRLGLSVLIAWSLVSARFGLCAKSAFPAAPRAWESETGSFFSKMILTIPSAARRSGA